MRNDIYFGNVITKIDHQKSMHRLDSTSTRIGLNLDLEFPMQIPSHRLLIAFCTFVCKRAFWIEFRLDFAFGSAFLRWKPGGREKGSDRRWKKTRWPGTVLLLVDKVRIISQLLFCVIFLSETFFVLRNCINYRGDDAFLVKCLEKKAYSVKDHSRHPEISFVRTFIAGLIIKIEHFDVLLLHPLSELQFSAYHAFCSSLRFCPGDGRGSLDPAS